MFTLKKLINFNMAGKGLKRQLSLRKVLLITITFNIFYVSGLELRYILIYTQTNTHPFDSIQVMKQYIFRERRCLFHNCYLTNDSSYLPDMKDFDAVLFNAMELDKLMENGLPDRRGPDQKYIFVSTESPNNYPFNHTLDKYFNWTMTYKLDSDIGMSYIAVRDRFGRIIGPKMEMHWMNISHMKPTSKYVRKKLRNKSTAVTWFVSNCHAKAKREEFALELRDALKEFGQQLDIYGRCGNLECPRYSDQCYALIESEYYFYLAFENSFSDDYVTEKLLNALEHFAVPVVYGGANYTRFLPDGAYLDARELGPKKLAKVIYESILNKKKYYEFFKWRRYYSFHDPMESPESDWFCGLCAAVNDMNRRRVRSVIEKFADWWNKPTERPEITKQSFKYYVKK